MLIKSKLALSTHSHCRPSLWVLKQGAQASHLVFIVKSHEQTQPESVQARASFFCSIIMAGDESWEVKEQEQAPHLKLPLKAVAGLPLPSWLY